MGITGLWPILEPSCQPVSLESLEGKKLAIDVSIWIYQAQLGYSQDARCPHVALLISRLSKLLFYKIRPVFVFDGPAVPSFKAKVLEARRNKKIHEEIALTTSKKRCLEELANNPESNDLVDNVKKKLSPMKRLREEDRVFNLPSTSREVIEVSDDDDAEIIVDKQISVFDSLGGGDGMVDSLVEERERIRNSRLHSDAIPKNTEEFCQFQLQRLLGKNKLDRCIKQLRKEHVDNVLGGDTRVMATEGRTRTHVITMDRDMDVQEIPHDHVSNPRSLEWGHVTLPLNLFPSPTKLPEQTIEDVNDSIRQLREAAKVESRSFLSKSRMIENLMQRRIGQAEKEHVVRDEWSSSESGEDFIDVPNLSDFPDGRISQDTSCSSNLPVTEKNKEWDPALDPSEWSDRGRMDFSQSTEFNAPQERDPGAYKDLQDFLTACGFPWVESPGEAEAQCVELESLGLVEGVVSDDSDVWAFGAKCVYRHLFSTKKTVQYYNADKIQELLGLTQAEVITIGLLSGGDYSDGLVGVGVVNAIELLAEFAVGSAADVKNKAMAVLRNIYDWLLKVGQNTVTCEGSPLKGEPTSSRRKLRSLIEKRNETNDFKVLINSDIVDAYVNPNVDHSKEIFRWRRVNFEKVWDLLREKLAWEKDKFEKTTQPALERWNSFISGETSYQRHITSYTLAQSTMEQKTCLTKRVQTALARLANKKAIAPPTLICEASIVDEGTVPINRKRGSKSKRKREKELKTDGSAQPPTALDLSENSDSDWEQ